MKNILYSSLFFIGLVALISVQYSTSANDAPIPYIYYHSDTANGLVVERADGTDSRFIGLSGESPGVMRISNLDWSPSGKWIAWLISAYGPSGPAYGASISRTDGSERLTLLDSYYPIAALEWSPARDLLFAAYRVGRRELQLAIIDVEAEQIIAQANYESNEWFPGWYEGLSGGWLTSGTEVYAVVGSSPTVLVTRLNINNQSTTRIFGADTSIMPEDQTQQLVNIRSTRMFYRRIRDDKPGYDLVMEDLSTRKRLLFAENPDPVNRYQVYWNAPMTAALVVTTGCWEQNCPKPQLHLIDWEVGEVYFIGDDLRPNDYRDSIYYSDLWSPNGRYAVLQDTPGTPFLLDAVDRKTYPITTKLEYSRWDWAEADNALLITVPRGEYPTYRYDLLLHQTTPLDLDIEPYYLRLFTSPDGHYLGLATSPVADYDLLDLQTGERHGWAHHSLGASAGGIMNYLWHPGGEWLMTGENSTFSSGGPGPSAVNILNLDGTVRRELTVCSALGTCAGFVPERALAYLGEGAEKSVIPEPKYSLPHDEKVVGVSWSVDGNKIASYSLHDEYETGGVLYIWDVSGTPEKIAAYPTDFTCHPFPYPCGMSWSADGKSVTLDNHQAREVWDIKAGKVIEPPSSPDILCEGYSERRLSLDERYMACYGFDKPSILIFDAQSERLIDEISDIRGYSVAWSTDGQQLFLHDGSDFVQVWDGEMTGSLYSEGDNYSFATRPRGKYIAGASIYHRIYVWDAETRQRLDDINWYAKGVSFNPDGTRLAAAGTTLVTIWDLENWEGR